MPPLHYKWKVSRKSDGSLKCLSHNIASLVEPEMLVTVVAVDSTRHIEIHLETDKDDCDI